MSRATTAARLRDLEARVAELETINARLVAVMGRFLTMLDERTLIATEAQVELEVAIANEAVERETAVRSRAPWFQISDHCSSDRRQKSAEILLGVETERDQQGAGTDL